MTPICQLHTTFTAISANCPHLAQFFVFCFFLFYFLFFPQTVPIWQSGQSFLKQFIDYSQREHRWRSARTLQGQGPAITLLALRRRESIGLLTPRLTQEHQTLSRTPGTFCLSCPTAPLLLRGSTWKVCPTGIFWWAVARVTETRHLRLKANNAQEKKRKKKTARWHFCRWWVKVLQDFQHYFPN